MSIHRFAALSVRAALSANSRTKVLRSGTGQGTMEMLTSVMNRRLSAVQPAPSTPQAPRNDTGSKPSQSLEKKELEEKEVEKSPEPSTNKIPDIPSNSWSSIGFEPEDANDPNKWKKFAWKYVGAVLLFFVSYKTLHWYVDRIEEEGKQKKKNLEESREFSNELKQSGSSTMGVSSMFQNIEQNAELKKMMESVAEGGGGQTSSELEELYRYRDELDARLRDLRKQGRNSEIDAEKKDIKLELSALSEEISILERKNKS